jgi:EAL domain-containing protein (putative c-di-GMP-specific phosphodiesterase class I)
VGKTDEIDFETAVSELRSQAGGALDPYLVHAMLEDIDILRKSVEFILTRDKHKRRTDAYGIKLLYHPVYDIRDNKIDSYRVELRLNDSYYGMIKPAVFISVAEQSGQIFRLEKLAFERLCMELDALYDPEKPLIECIVPFSARQFEKKGFLKFIKTVTAKYEIEPRQLLFSVRDADLMSTEVEVDWQSTVDACRKEGFRFILEGFGDGSSLLSRLDTLSVDRICLKPEYTARIAENPKTHSVVAGLVKIATTLQITTMFLRVEKRAQEADLLAMGAKYACGDLYGEGLTWKNLRDGELSPSEEDDGGDAV